MFKVMKRWTRLWVHWFRVQGVQGSCHSLGVLCREPDTFRSNLISLSVSQRVDALSFMVCVHSEEG